MCDAAADDLDPKYTEICSERTVQSTAEGFFQELFDTVCAAVPAQWLQQTFARQTDAAAQMRCVLPPLLKTKTECSRAAAALWSMLEHVQPVFKPKDARVSVQRRRDGERLAEAERWPEALTMLSQAVLRAPPNAADLQSDGGKHLALALWSRAGVLLELNAGQAALSDLTYAVECGLPAKQHAAYYLRLARANAMCGDQAKAHVCLALGERLCKDPETQRGLAKLRTEIDKIVVCHPELAPQLPTVTDGCHPQLPDASSLLDVRHDDDQCTTTTKSSTTISGAGRYAVAGRPIATGATLLVEQPHVARLLPDCQGSHCLHCMRLLRAPQLVPYGCDGCAAVAFCSPACKRAACSTYHRFECEYGDLLIGSGMSALCFAALRAVTQCTDAADAVRRNRPAVATLCGHQLERSACDRLRRSVMAAFLLSVLQKAGFFGAQRVCAYEMVAAVRPDELDVAVVLLGLLEVLQFNAHEIFETRLGRTHRVAGSKPAHIGVGLYRSGALFNHDCHPAVGRYFVGQTMVVRATRALARGETVGENYGPQFGRRTREQRQRELRSRYWFRCGCRSCTEDWPLLEKLDNRARLRCPTEHCTAIHPFPLDAGKAVNCRKCRSLVVLLESVRLVRDCEDRYREAAQLMEAQNTVAAIDVFAAALDQFYAVAVAPHKDTHMAQESLRMCLCDQGTCVSWPTGAPTTKATTPTNRRRIAALDLD